MGGFTEAVYLEATCGMRATGFDLEGNSLSGLADKLSDAINKAGCIGTMPHHWHGLGCRGSCGALLGL